MLELRPSCECCDKDLPPEAAERDDLHVRMHVLPRLRRHPARRAVPELRRQFRPASDPAGREAGEVPALDPARVQARGLRAGGREVGQLPGLGGREILLYICFEPAGS